MADSTAPIGAVERASIARLLEASRDAIRDPRLRLLDRLDLAQHLAGMCDQAALTLRQGYRAHLLDRPTAELDQRLQHLADAASRPSATRPTRSRSTRLIAPSPTAAHDDDPALTRPGPRQSDPSA